MSWRGGLKAWTVLLAMGLLLAAPSAASADAVDDFQGSWTDRALELQYALAEDVPLRNAQWVGTHNSFNSIAEMGQTLSTSDSNQVLGITDQLELGITSLELDVHWFRTERAGGDFAPVVCHARGREQQHFGCSTEKLLGPVLAEIADWLQQPANRDVVLLLYLEDHLDEPAAYQRASTALDYNLGKLLYRPGGSDTCTQLPLDLTRNEVFESGARVIPVGGCGLGPWRSRVYAWDDHLESRPFGYTDFPGCGADYERAEYEQTIVRYFEDRTKLTEAIGNADERLTPATVAAMARCGVDLIGMDQLTPGDGRLEAAVWSWAPKQPIRRGKCAVQWGVATPSRSRWYAGACRRRRHVACRRAEEWIVGPRVRPAYGGRACSAAGAVFAVPRTGHEVQLLRLAMRRAKVLSVWLGYRRNESGWTALDRRA